MADLVATHRLTEEASLKMIQAGIAKANELGCKVSLAVVDQSCRLIAFVMMDGAKHFSIITTKRKAITPALAGDIPNAIDRPPGCHFHPRCPLAIDVCRTDAPAMTEFGPGHVASCHVTAAEHRTRGA